MTGPATMTKCPRHPKHPERICWGCDQYCPATSLACGNGTVRTPHPAELFGDDWYEWSQARNEPDSSSEDDENELANDPSDTDAKSP
jgi:hypothetical protein